MTIASKKQQNRVCEGCEYTRNCVNGLFCTKLKIYVEYKKKSMYTVKQFEIAKPANVVYSNFRLKDHNVLYAL